MHLVRCMTLVVIALATLAGCSSDSPPTGGNGGAAGAGTSSAGSAGTGTGGGGNGGTSSAGSAGTGTDAGDCRTSGCMAGESCAECLGPDNDTIWACIPDGSGC